MQIRIRYDNSFQTVEVTEAECESMIRNDYEERRAAAADPSTVQPRTMQEIMDERFNKPEYNNYHKHFRRTLGLDYFDYEGELFVDDTENPSTILEMEELVETISEIVCQMPADWQIVLKGFLFEGKSLSDVARELGMHRSSISRRLIKILPVLQENLKNF